ncbi:hypothetical protein SAMN05660297_01983 [Natronincola peptidivorans]|uniref:YgjP-like metallopeptidase domain-containing protein n=1 Tax=Natronincola peptidivorans TaxID=426128 RepID=A0A1I0DCT7_9FIRM|nr:SprT family zinc-dependent metalloprotease [Natronincola peptidivorans]SET30043.1 hypothetical protein SAMN05660297_01983 [Natronincola peptidivorans]
MDKMTIEGIDMEVILKKNKNIYLSVHPPNGRVRVVAPKKMNPEAVKLFVLSKLSWIKKQRAKFQHQKIQPKREFVSGESHFFEGSSYALNVIETTGKQRVEMRNSNSMDLYVRPESTVEKRQKIMNEWYRNHLKTVIPDYIEKWEDTMEVSVNSWGVKRMKTRWGTCNPAAKRIWINLELAKKSPRCLEYIIVHEMVHLLERNHNARFKEYMDKFLPNWRSLKSELNGLADQSIKV